MSAVYKIEKLLMHISSLSKARLKNNRVNAFWWSGVKNFGDLLTKEILDAYGKTAVNTPGRSAQVCGVGSILHILPADYQGMILGSGCIRNEFLDLSLAEFRFVRGELTKKALKLESSLPTGDLGLLAYKLVDQDIGKVKKKYQCGIIPHYVDQNHSWLKKIKSELKEHCIIIDVKNSASMVSRQIEMCETIYSSSLHGIIVADSLNIPNTWIKLSNNVVGDGFKFSDYNSSIDHEQTFLEVNQSTTIKKLDAALNYKSLTRINKKCNELDILLRMALREI